MIPRKLWQLVRRIWRKPDAMKITSCTAAKAHEPLSTKDTKHTTSSQKHIPQTYASEMWPTLFVVCSAYPTILLYTKVSHSNQKTVKIITRLILNAPQASMMTSRKKNPSCKLKATLPNLNHSPTNLGWNTVCQFKLILRENPPTLFFLRINVSMMSFQEGWHPCFTNSSHTQELNIYTFIKKPATSNRQTSRTVDPSNLTGNTARPH